MLSRATSQARPQASIGAHCIMQKGNPYRPKSILRSHMREHYLLYSCVTALLNLVLIAHLKKPSIAARHVSIFVTRGRESR